VLTSCVPAAPCTRLFPVAAVDVFFQAIPPPRSSTLSPYTTLFRSAGREGQGQPRVDRLRRGVAQVDGHGAGGRGREVERVEPAARLVDRVAAQSQVRVETVAVVARPAGQQVVARSADQYVVAQPAGQRVVTVAAVEDIVQGIAHERVT